MRARNIKPGFWKNEDLVELGFETRLLFVGLWMLADREGRLEDRPKRIKMEVFPADNVDVGACLDELESFGLVERYQADGKRVVCIPNFTVHQSPHHSEKRSDLPDKNGEYGTGKAADSEKTNQTKTVDSGKSRESHGEPTVGSRNHHGRNRPDSLNPDSLNPESTVEGAQDAPTSATGKQPRSKPKRATQLPDDFTPTDKHRDLAKSLGINLDAEFAKFADHHRAKGSTMKDWHAALNSWMRKAVDFGNAARPQAPPGPRHREPDFSNIDYHAGIDANGGF